LHHHLRRPPRIDLKSEYRVGTKPAIGGIPSFLLPAASCHCAKTHPPFVWHIGRRAVIDEPMALIQSNGVIVVGLH